MFCKHGFKCLRARSNRAVVGDYVVVKDRGDAKVKEITADGKTMCVEFGNGDVKTVATKKIRQSLSRESKGTNVVACYLTKEYRQMAIDYIFPDDRVLEIGCHEGITTDIIAKRCGNNVLGVDKSAKTIDDARRRFPKVRFKVVDALNMESVLSLANQFMAEWTASKSAKSKSAKSTPTACTATTTTQSQNTAVNETTASDATEMSEACAASSASAIAKGNSPVAPAQPRAGTKRSSPSEGEGEQEEGTAPPLSKKMKRQLQHVWTKIFIDIGGNASLPKVIECVSKVDATFKPDLIVVKSKSFRNLMDRTSIFGLQSSFERPRRTRNSQSKARNTDKYLY